MSRTDLIIYCHCAHYELVPAEAKSAVLGAVKAAGVRCEIVADLCRLCAERDPILKEWARSSPLKIFACYGRAVRWLFHAAGAELPQQGVEIINIRTTPLEQVLAMLDSSGSACRAAAEVAPEKPGDWIPWFPVIDYDRCQNCKQCYGFCLFGVYQLDENGKVRVANPANCKTNCPACAKACPQTAIIFPKSAESPINGDEPGEGAGQQAGTALTELLGEDIYAAIRSRSTAEAAVPSGQDRSDLKALCEKLGIPPEVIASLSDSEIAGLSGKSADTSKGRAVQDEAAKGKNEYDEA